MARRASNALVEAKAPQKALAALKNAVPFQPVLVLHVMNEQRCKEYSGEEIGRLVQVKYEGRDEGFSCASCSYYARQQYITRLSLLKKSPPSGYA
jgi:hypothetical protein